MGSLSSLLDLSQSALTANQAAIDITANNVANQNTLGYTRRIASWESTDTITLSNGTSTSNAVSVTAVPQRDRVLDQRVQQQTQAQSAAATASAQLNQLESIFGLTSTSGSAASTTLGGDLNTLFDSLSSLQSSPADTSVRQGVISAAQKLASDLNSATKQISAQGQALNEEISGIVPQVNTLTEAIAKLNSQIARAGSATDAGTLEDQRQSDLTTLSTYLGFNQRTTEGNGIALTTTSGYLLVSGDQAFPLVTSSAAGNVEVSTSSTAASLPITASKDGGQLGGALQARDTILPTYQASLNQLAFALGSALNAQNQAGLDANGNPGGAIFSLPATSSGAAGSISVLLSDPNTIAAAGPGEGTSGGGNAALLSALKDISLVTGQTATGFFASFLTQLGSAVSSASESNTVAQASLTQLTTLQDSLSGVSLDQEAANLTQYQRSYEAAAKVFSIVDELLASALNLGEQTTVT